MRIIKEIRAGKTFYRSGLSQTLENKMLWDELRAEVNEGYPIDLPEEPSSMRIAA